MRNYTVTWKVEVDAETPEGAAKMARFVMDDHTRLNDTFEVECIEDVAAEPCSVSITVTR